MKKALIAVAVVFAAVALALWIASWFVDEKAVAKSAERPWPAGLGALESVAARYPPMQANNAAVKLTALANALPKNDAPPVLPDVSAIRELLLRDEIVWARRGGVGGIGDAEMTATRAMQMNTARTLVASALAKARGNDAAAWQDLHAVWMLARSLDAQPQMMMQTAALSMVRMVNGVAWKMPLPVPPWFGEMQQRDDVRRLLAAFQFQVASYWESGASIYPTRSLAGSVEHDRRIAETVASETRCDVNVPMNDLGVDLSSVWRRAFRSRAEREATANALRIRTGQAIATTSRCSDGAWTFDGTTLRFSREIPTAAPDRPMPLVLRVHP